MQEKIKIINARVHNLKNVSLEIPKNKLVVITGLSGSGKSSLAFDTIYAEGQRRYAESLSSYARQFMDIQDKPDVDEIQGLSPTIAINQKNFSQNPRSTVGTATEIYDLIRLLFARAGKQYCIDCQIPVKSHTSGEIVEAIRRLRKQKNNLILVAPFIKNQKIKNRDLINNLVKTNVEKILINGLTTSLKEISNFKFNPNNNYDIDILITNINPKTNLLKDVEKTLELGNGYLKIISDDGEIYKYSTLPVCESCGRSYPPIDTSAFSFNNPRGACPRCTGLGKTLEIDPELIIPNPRLTLAEGAIQPWTRLVGNQNFYQELLEQVACRHCFSIDESIEKLKQDAINIIFYGTNNEKYNIKNGTVIFEGVIPNLTNRYLETKSDYVKKEIEQYMQEKICPVCEGKRLKKESLSIKIGNFNISDVVGMNVDEIYNIFKEQQKNISQSDKNQLKIIQPINHEIERRIQHLIKVGLSYISLDRPLNTLSGGEAQRIRLSTQLSSGLSGLIYILDEPSIGLHYKDNEKLIHTLKDLRDAGNSVIVVEHDKSIIESADYIIDIGPGAGEYGGEIIVAGNIVQIKNNKKSLTGLYLTDKEKISEPKKFRRGNGKNIEIIGAKANNLKNINVTIPLGKLTSITGVSGSGKSTLIVDILSKTLNKKFYRAKAEPGEHQTIKGLNAIDKVISIDQTPIGRTPRSNPATYTGIFTLIRDLYAELKESKMRGFNAGMFSFNVKDGGRCEACSGEGYTAIPMHFLNDVYIECNECHGTRYTAEVLEIHYNGKNIADILNFTVEEAFKFFQSKPNIREKLQVLRNVGLGYVKLGQPATTLSGGEAQRIKLASELSRRSTGKTLYILDEPSTGLHFEDIKKLLHILNQLVDKGNTVLIIEHNLDIIKSSDWVIDLGPEGGKKGGEIIAQGTPKDVAEIKSSWTGKYLKKMIEI